MKAVLFKWTLYIHVIPIPMYTLVLHVVREWWSRTYFVLFRLGRKSGTTIGLDRSRGESGDRTWDYVRSVSFMYGSLRRSFETRKTIWLTMFMLLWNLLAINLCWDCITIRNDIYDFLLLTFCMSHILQPSNVAFALIIAPTKPQN